MSLLCNAEFQQKTQKWKRSLVRKCHTQKIKDWCPEAIHHPNEKAAKYFNNCFGHGMELRDISLSGRTFALQAQGFGKEGRKEEGQKEI